MREVLFLPQVIVSAPGACFGEAATVVLLSLMVTAEAALESP